MAIANVDSDRHSLSNVFASAHETWGAHCNTLQYTAIHCNRLQQTAPVFASAHETWGAGVDLHTVDTRPSPFQLRTHFLVRFVPNKLPLPRAHEMVLHDM